MPERCRNWSASEASVRTRAISRISFPSTSEPNNRHFRLSSGQSARCTLIGSASARTFANTSSARNGANGASSSGPANFDEFVDDGDSDDMLDEAIATVAEAKKASASLLQRRLKVGYARAARLLDLMESAGYIGPGDGAKPRDVNVEKIEQRLS